MHQNQCLPQFRPVFSSPVSPCLFFLEWGHKSKRLEDIFYHLERSPKKYMLRTSSSFKQTIVVDIFCTMQTDTIPWNLFIHTMGENKLKQRANNGCKDFSQSKISLANISKQTTILFKTNNFQIQNINENPMCYQHVKKKKKKFIIM